jgi:hypothetical protein
MRIPMDYLKYYSLEDYLFSDVNCAFHEHGYLTPEQFFSIVIWKANRAKGRIWKKLLKHGTDLSLVVKTLTQAIHDAEGDDERLSLLLDQRTWGFALPMASAIITVCYPERFTIYDVRVRMEFGIKDFAGRKDQIERYFKQFVPKVKAITAPHAESLRDKDRYLWGKSSYRDLQKFIQGPKKKS